VAQSYVAEHAQVLRADLVSLANDLDQAYPLFESNPSRFVTYLNTQARIRALPFVAILNQDGSTLLKAQTPFPEDFRTPPSKVLAEVTDDQPFLISPGTTNQISGLMKLRNFNNATLYIARTVDPQVIQYLNVTRQNLEEYQDIQERRYGVQLAFGLMFLGMALVVVLAALWFAINFANRLVSPIQRLIHATDQVSSGNLYVQVPIRPNEGDLGNLATTFNNMIAQLRTSRDELLNAKEQIDSRRRFTEAVLSGVPAGVISLDEKGVITLANRKAHDILVAEEDEVLHRPVAEISPSLAALFQSALSMSGRLFEKDIMLSHGTQQRQYAVRAIGEKAGQNRSSVLMTFDDITDLLSAQRSAAWADIARRIAHEIKNPLTPIQLATERIKRRFGRQIAQDKDIFDQCTQTILRQVDDIRSMVDEFSSFARMPQADFQIHDLRQIVEEMVFSMGVGREDVAITASLPDGPVRLALDERMIRQVLTNLIKNAQEATISYLKQQQRIQGEKERPKAHIQVDLINPEKENVVCMLICDNGPGFPDNNRKKLLEPYMTTRSKGTGLGLAIVKRIVEEHGGALELLDAADVNRGEQGACVAFTLSKNNMSRKKKEEKASHGV
jgi:two-component system nitrogen regulation sensor histidine kinase NtrY